MQDVSRRSNHAWSPALHSVVVQCARGLAGRAGAAEMTMTWRRHRPPRVRNAGAREKTGARLVQRVGERRDCGRAYAKRRRLGRRHASDDLKTMPTLRHCLCAVASCLFAPEASLPQWSVSDSPPWTPKMQPPRGCASVGLREPYGPCPRGVGHSGARCVAGACLTRAPRSAARGLGSFSKKFPFKIITRVYCILLRYLLYIYIL